MEMTALEYMEKQLWKHKLDYGREAIRCVPKEQLENIALKISYYEEAVTALRNEMNRDAS